MGDGTGIQWTDATWNPLRARHRETGAEGWACVKVSPGCVNCYSKVMNQKQRFGKGTGLDYTVPALAQVEPYLDEATLTQPLRWRNPRRIFVCSMTDLFGDWVTDEQIDRIFAVMALTPQHTYQVLTKRPERMRAYLTTDDRDEAIGWKAHDLYEHHGGAYEVANGLLHPRIHGMRSVWPLPNVWLGVSVESQQYADERIPLLLDTPASVRFLSCEPLLEAVDLTDLDYRVTLARYYPDYAKPKHPHDPEIRYDVLAGHMKGPDDTGLPKVDWVIVGGESGKGARAFDLAWARSLVQQCQDAGTAVFVKQLGSKPYESPDRDGGTGYMVHLRHPHGGNPEEWPEDLRVREWPGMREDVR